MWTCGRWQLSQYEPHQLDAIPSLTSEAILLYNDTEKDVATDLVHRMIQRAIAMEGTITGEHGVGLKKREYLREELGEETVDAMRRVSLDPSNSSLLLRLTSGYS